MPKYTLYNDDCTIKVNDFIKDNILVDAIITDPPYNISKETRWGLLKGFKGLDFGEWDKGFDLTSWIADYTKILKKGGTIIIFTSYNSLSPIITELEKNDIIIKDLIVWSKTNPMPRNRTRLYVKDKEYAIYGVKKGAKWTFNYNPNKTYERSTYSYPIVVGKEKTKHTTQKSLKLMIDLILLHTNENDTIIDCFSGSGTTGHACLLNNRNFIGIEKDTTYFNIMKDRLDSIPPLILEI